MAAPFSCRNKTQEENENDNLTPASSSGPTDGKFRAFAAAVVGQFVRSLCSSFALLSLAISCLPVIFIEQNNIGSADKS